MAQTPRTYPQAPRNTRTFPGEVPTRGPVGDQHRFFGKIPMRPGPYGSGTATATFSSSSGCRRHCQSFTGNLHYVEQKMVQDTLRSLKAIWHFVKFNPIPHILPVLSKLRCPMNLASLPCLPLQNRISFQREMCPSKICIFLASNYGNIFHLLCLSVRAFSLPFRIALVGHSVLNPDLLQKDWLAKEFPELSLWEAESPSRKWAQFGKLVLTHCGDKTSVFRNSDEKVVSLTRLKGPNNPYSVQ